MEDQLYFEDFGVGTTFTSPARTITESDIAQFAGLSGDYNALHTDEEFAKSTVYGGRIAHGLLGLAIASGLFTRTELNRRMGPSIIGLLGLDSWKFLKPIKANDTIHLHIEIIQTQLSKSKNKGVVHFKRSVLNQNDEVVQEGITPMLIKSKEEIECHSN